MAEKVDNAYRSALVAARPRVTSVGSDIRELLDAAVTAMNNGAWKGGKADAFFAELTGQQQALRKVKANALEDLQTEIDSQPLEVEADDDRATWTG